MGTSSIEQKTPRSAGRYAVRSRAGWPRGQIQCTFRTPADVPWERGRNANFIGIPYILFFGIIYCVWMCAEEGWGLDTIIILVPKFSDSCQSSGGEKPVGTWRKEGTSSAFSGSHQSSVNLGPWISFSPTWPLRPNCLQHRTPPLPPFPAILLCTFYQFLKKQSELSQSLRSVVCNLDFWIAAGHRSWLLSTRYV